MSTALSGLYAPTITPKDEKVSINVRVPKKLREDFANLCKGRNVDVSTVITRFIESELGSLSIPEAKALGTS